MKLTLFAKTNNNFSLLLISVPTGFYNFGILPVQSSSTMYINALQIVVSSYFITLKNKYRKYKIGWECW